MRELTRRGPLVPVDGVTDTDAAPLRPSLTAVIVAEPVAIPLTTPVPPFTLATEGLLELHDTARPDSTLLLASRSVAVSDTVPPTATFAGDGVTVTVATGTGVTVTEAVPLFPSDVAVIVTGPPEDTPFTIPVLALTVATAALLELQTMERPVNVLLSASVAVAVSCVVAPVITLDDAGDTVTFATGTTVTVIALVPAFPSLVAVMVALPTATAVTSPL